MIDDVLFDVCRFVSIGLSEHTQFPNTPRSIIFLRYYLPITCFNTKHRYHNIIFTDTAIMATR